MARKKFVRHGAHKFSKLGLRRKKKQIYRKAKGRDSKTRLHRIGRVVNVRIGYGHARKQRGLHQGEQVMVVYNVSDLEKIPQKTVVVVGNVGTKKKLAIVRYALEKKIKLKNVKGAEFVAEVEKTMDERKNKKKMHTTKKQVQEKENSQKSKKNEEEKHTHTHDHAKETGEEKEMHTQDKKSYKETAKDKEERA